MCQRSRHRVSGHGLRRAWPPSHNKQRDFISGLSHENEAFGLARARVVASRWARVNRPVPPGTRRVQPRTCTERLAAVQSEPLAAQTEPPQAPKAAEAVSRTARAVALPETALEASALGCGEARSSRPGAANPGSLLGLGATAAAAMQSQVSWGQSSGRRPWSPAPAQS
eukprot:scaffold297_cov108-Isochrysis_galbana.AAC.11